MPEARQPPIVDTSPEKGRGFRALLLGVTAVCWLAFVVLVLHKSAHPTWLGRYSRRDLVLVAASGALALLAALVHYRPIFRLAYRLRWKVSLLAASILVSLLAAEAACRAWDPLGISYYADVDRFFGLLQADADEKLLFRLRPGASARLSSFSVAANSIGFREREVGPKQPDEFRILVLGDSVAFGWGVNVDDGLCRRLEAELCRATGRKVSTVNGALMAYNTVQELEVLRQQGEKISPDAVVVVYVDNDVQRARRYSRLEQDSARSKSRLNSLKKLMEHSWLFRLAKFTAIDKRSGVTEAARSSAGWRESMGSLGAIADWCHDKKIPLVVCLYRMEPSPLTDSLRTEISAMSGAKKFEFCDARTWFADRPVKSLVRSVVDSHPNPAGHLILGNGLADFCRRVDILRERRAQKSSKPDDHSLSERAVHPGKATLSQRKEVVAP